MKSLHFDSLVIWSLQKRFNCTYLCLLIIFVVDTLLLNTLVMIFLIFFLYLNPFKLFLWYREQYQYLKLWDTHSKILVTTNNHRYIMFVVITIWTFPHSWHITGCVTRLTWLVATSGTGTAYPSRVPEFIPNF